MNKVLKTVGSLFLIVAGASIAAKGGKCLVDALSDTATQDVPKIIVIRREIISDAVEKVSEVAADAIDEVQEKVTEAKA